MNKAAREEERSHTNHDKVLAREFEVASAAYYLSEKRGFAPGRELDDWFRAEKAILEGRSGPEKMSGPTVARGRSSRGS